MKRILVVSSKWLAIGFVLWVGVLILTPYPSYFELTFDHGFLKGRESYFFSSGYGLGFFAHIVAAPLALLLGALNVCQIIRTRWHVVHRWIGRGYMMAVLVFATPGALVMSTRAHGGAISSICFASLAIVTFMVTLVGWKAAAHGSVIEHRDAMARSYVLMTSAVWLRVLHYAMQDLGFAPERLYQVAAWASWVLPLAGLEIVFYRIKKRSV